MSIARQQATQVARPRPQARVGGVSALLAGAILGVIGAAAKLPVDVIAGRDVGLLSLVLAVGVATWYGDRLAGASATVVSAVVDTYLLSVQSGALAPDGSGHWAALLLYLLVGLTAVAVVAALRESRDRETAAAMARERLHRTLAEREERLGALLDRERQATQLRDAFIDIVSHELRTPITVIVGSAKLLQRSADRLNDQDRALVGDVEAGAERLARLVDDLVVLVRSEREKIAEADEPVPLEPILAHAVATEAAWWSAIPFELVVDGRLPLVRGREDYLDQILANLLSNAAKYNSPGGRVQVRAGSEGDAVVVRVLDDGPGIAEEESERLFDLYYRSSATARSASGSGLGLYVCRRLVEAMGGSITARRRLEGGSEFIVRLRPYEGEPDAADGEPPGAELPGPGLPGTELPGTHETSRAETPRITSTAPGTPHPAPH